MPSITTWTRLEPRPRGDDMLPSLEARVHDPAWLLGRQWQLGEFVGEDAATPVHVELEVEVAPFVTYQSAAGGPIQAVGAVPLDCIAGAEPRGPMTAAGAAEAGAELVRLLREHGVDTSHVRQLVEAFPLTLPTGARADPEGEEFLSLLVGRLPDAAALAVELREVAATGVLSAGLAVLADVEEAAVATAVEWVRWLDGLELAAPDGADAWLADRFEHSFVVGVRPPGGGQMYALKAPQWDGDRVDWYDVDVDGTATAPSLPAAASAPQPLPGVDGTGKLKVSGIPAPLSYPGMPAARWWEFEDANVNFAQITAAKDDLARMLVVEFASVYSNDWFLWPLRLPVGAVHRVTLLRVSDTFNQTVTIGPAAVSAGGSPSADWQLFRPTELRQGQPSQPFDGLVLPATTSGTLVDGAIEEVRLLRDELENIGWALEVTVEGADGRPFDRHTDASKREGELPVGVDREPPDDTSLLNYRFRTDVPVYWFPLAPLQSGEPRLRCLVLPRTGDDGEDDPRPPLGKLLRAGLEIWQEEVPRDGAEIIRAHRLVRGVDGALHVWTSRRKRAGRGEGSSGLRFDDAVP